MAFAPGVGAHGDCGCCAGVCCDCGCGVRCEDHAGCDGAGCDGAGCDGAGCDVTYVFPWMNTCELQLRCRVVILLTECAALLCWVSTISGGEESVTVVVPSSSWSAEGRDASILFCSFLAFANGVIGLRPMSPRWLQQSTRSSTARGHGERPRREATERSHGERPLGRNTRSALRAGAQSRLS